MFNIIGITFRYNFTLEYPIVYGTKYITITIPYHFALIDMIRGDINGTFAIIKLQIQHTIHTLELTFQMICIAILTSNLLLNVFKSRFNLRWKSLPCDANFKCTY